MPAVATTIEPFALSPREAAKCLAVSKRTISRLITARKIVARKVGSRTLVDGREPERLLRVAQAQGRSSAACIRPAGACGSGPTPEASLMRGATILD